MLAVKLAFARPSMPMRRSRGESSLLRLRRLFLITLAPFLVRHAVDERPALLLRERAPGSVGRVLEPVREAVAAKAREIHQVDVLHIGALAQMRDEPAIDGGFERGRERVGAGVRGDILVGLFRASDLGPARMM